MASTGSSSEPRVMRTKMQYLNAEFNPRKRAAKERIFLMNKLPPIFLLFSISFFATCDKKIDIETGLAEVNSTQLYYEVAGTGTPIVLIHGHGGDRRHWDDQFEAFAKNHKVIRYDVRGFGKSAKPVLEQSYSNHDDLKALLQHLGISKAHICGFSMGSGIAVDFSLAYPNMCYSLIAIGPWVQGYNSPATEEIFTVLGKISSIAKEKGSRAATDYWITGNEVFRNTLRNPRTVEHLKNVNYDYSFWHLINNDPVLIVDPPAAKQIAKIGLPTLIVTAEYDIEACREIADLMEQNIKGAQKVDIADAGHAMNMDKPSEFNRIVLDFLSGVSSN